MNSDFLKENFSEYYGEKNKEMIFVFVFLNTILNEYSNQNILVYFTQRYLIDLLCITK